MYNLIKSDFYKLLRTKAFYICGVMAAIMSLIGVIMVNSIVSSSMGSMSEVSPSMLGCDGIYALITGTGQAGLFITIMISMFIPNEFSFGTIKNIASGGASRINIYLSKIILGVFISVSYILLCGIVSFTAGSIMWGTGELTRAVYLDVFRAIGLFILAEFALQSIFIMVGFFIRQTGGTVATSLAISTVVPSLLVSAIDFAVYKCFNIENFDSSKYWVQSYSSKFLSMDIVQSDINLGIIVCAVTILISTATGIFFFCKRDIK